MNRDASPSTASLHLIVQFSAATFATSWHLFVMVLLFPL